LDAVTIHRDLNSKKLAIPHSDRRELHGDSSREGTSPKVGTSWVCLKNPTKVTLAVVEWVKENSG
jgi:hypothetical protein